MSRRGCRRRGDRQDQKAMKRWDQRQFEADLRRADPKPTKQELQGKTCGDVNCPTCAPNPDVGIRTNLNGVDLTDRQAVFNAILDHETNGGCGR